jgi:hypothetical protein
LASVRWSRHRAKKRENRSDLLRAIRAELVARKDYVGPSHLTCGSLRIVAEFNAQTCSCASDVIRQPHCPNAAPPLFHLVLFQTRKANVVLRKWSASARGPTQTSLRLRSCVLLSSQSGLVVLSTSYFECDPNGTWHCVIVQIKTSASASRTRLSSAVWEGIALRTQKVLPNGSGCIHE